ncbi:hypothetical protein COO60DRAFT_714826 [Scenedesmus sp. NREL 46B-D3]|nr:hypothetical protein COO60DRAFT_714826 [Scenedesmus sp. NREL 46B-D3]
MSPGLVVFSFPALHPDMAGACRVGGWPCRGQAPCTQQVCDGDGMCQGFAQLSACKCSHEQIRHQLHCLLYRTLEPCRQPYCPAGAADEPVTNCTEAAAEMVAATALSSVLLTDDPVTNCTAQQVLLTSPRLLPRMVAATVLSCIATDDPVTNHTAQQVLLTSPRLLPRMVTSIVLSSVLPTDDPVTNCTAQRCC